MNRLNIISFFIKYIYFAIPSKAQGKQNGAQGVKINALLNLRQYRTNLTRAWPLGSCVKH